MEDREGPAPPIFSYFRGAFAAERKEFDSMQQFFAEYRERQKEIKSFLHLRMHGRMCRALATIYAQSNDLERVLIETQKMDALLIVSAKQGTRLNADIRAHPYKMAGWLLEQNRRLPEAIAHYRKALAHNSQDTELQAALARLSDAP